MDMMYIDGEMSKYYGWSKSDVDNLELYQWRFYFDEMKRNIESGNQ